VAVIGAGYLGLFTALYLLKSKYLVTIYSDNTVQDDPYAQQKDLITSQVAGGFWMPFGYNGDQQQELHEMATRMSHYFYKQSIQNKWYLGVRDMKAYHFDSIDIIKKTIPRGLFQEFQEVEVTFGKKDSDNKDIYHKAWSYPTFMIDSDLFLRELQLELKARGATFVQKRFANKQEVLSLSENYIFNCSGMGSKMLFDDDNFEPVKGQLVAFKKNSPQINYYLSADLNGSRVTLYPHYKTFCVGITYEKNTWDDKPDEKVAL
jgi:glycine/D-amino acid oxidase-like deaminating enzyme